jgi:hypothetical protein
MKKLLPFILLIFIPYLVSGQYKNTIYGTYSLSKPSPLYHKPLEGVPSRYPMLSHSVGIRYVIKSPKAIGFETGIEYSRYQFTIRDHRIDYHHETANLVTLPLYVNVTFLKFFYINGGLLIDSEFGKQQHAIQNQSGIGFGAGLGARLNYRKVSFFINPSVESHAFIPFKKQKASTRQSIFNHGWRAGIGYTF